MVEELNPEFATLLEAAENGDAEAMYQMAMFYSPAEGGSDMGKAIYWMKKAAEDSGDASMMALYALMLRTAREHEASLYQLAKAAVFGDENARNWLKSGAFNEPMDFDDDKTVDIDEIYIKTIISEHFAKDISEFNGDTELITGLELDSLDCVELIQALEQEFEIKIPDEDAEQWCIVNDVVNHIKENK